MNVQTTNPELKYFLTNQIGFEGKTLENFKNCKTCSNWSKRVFKFCSMYISELVVGSNEHWSIFEDA